VAEVAFTVAGTPVAQGSLRSLGKGRPTIAGNRDTLVPWRNAVAAEAAMVMPPRPLTGPLELDVTFVFGRPKGHYGSGRNHATLKPSAPMFCDKRPDLDKLVRAIGDALTGVLVVDDAQFVELHARKHYGAPAAHVVVRQARA